MSMTREEIEKEMVNLESMLVFIDSRIHEDLRVLVRAEDKYAALRKEVDKFPRLPNP